MRCDQPLSVKQAEEVQVQHWKEELRDALTAEDPPSVGLQVVSTLQLIYLFVLARVPFPGMVETCNFHSSTTRNYESPQEGQFFF